MEVKKGSEGGTHERHREEEIMNFGCFIQVIYKIRAS